MRRSFALLAASTGLIGTLIACSGGAATPAKPGPAAAFPTSDVLVIASMADLGNLNPIVYETESDATVLSTITVPTIDSRFDCSLKKEPGLATEWSWSPDGKVLSLTLRDDLTWEDGKPVTAHDLAFTYDMVANPTVASPRIGYLDKMVEGKRPLVIDATHLEFHFTEAYDRDTQAAHAGLTPMPAHLFADADPGTLRGHPISKSGAPFGPFRLAKHEPNQRIVLEPNPNYTGPDAWRPHLNRVIFRIIPEYSTRLIELTNGGVDMMDSILVEDADMLREKHPAIKVVRRGWRTSDYVGWNLTNPLFTDKSVRKALAMAVNVDGMIEKLLTGKDGEVYARRAVGTITPELCTVHNDGITPLPYDLTESKAILAAAGWADTDNDGWLDKDGKVFEFTLTTNAGNKRRASASVLIQANLKDVGVRVNIETLESNTFFTNLRARDFEAALAGWSAALFVDPSSMWHSDTPEKKYEFNFTSYSNPAVDALIDQGLSIPDPVEAGKVWSELQEIVYDDQPYMFLWWRDELVAINDRFENTRIDVLSRLNHVHEWSVPEGKVKYKH